MVLLLKAVVFVAKGAKMMKKNREERKDGKILRKGDSRSEDVREEPTNLQ